MLLLTGATGYLGSQIARALIGCGVQFRVLVRQPSRLDFDPALAGVEVFRGDLRDVTSLEVALRRVKSVIHTAAVVKMWTRDQGEFWRVNVEGLQSLLRVAASAGVERVIYTSSFIALGPSSDPSAGEGLRHPGPYRNEYEKTKACALAWLRNEGFGRFPVVALLPGVIYGPGPQTGGNLTGAMIAQYLHGTLPGVPGSGEQRWSFAFMADVVKAHLAALERGQPGEEYILGGDNRSLNEFFATLAELSGVRRRLRHLPFTAAKMAGALELARARLFGHQPAITPAVAEIFRQDWVYSSAKAQAQLGYCVTSLAEGLKQTLEARHG